MNLRSNFNFAVILGKISNFRKILLYCYTRKSFYYRSKVQEDY